ncbi:peptide deformylase, mitochondrial isoform X3 [Nomia melanderi]|nr:peptide deformylase, mitochondrial-like isoform X3 [Nomia melanderi]
MKATPVDLKIIKTHEFQTILQKLSKVIKKYDLVGAAAPQIGISLQIFAIQVTEGQIARVTPQVCEAYEMEPLPLTYFINPTIKIINPTQVIHHESCGSITGFGASVSRAKEVEVKAFNQLGDTFSWQAKGLAARIIQHEYDHLQGKLYIDRMDPSTFECPIWELINVKNDISEEEPLAGSMRTVFLLDRLRKSP